MANEKFGGDQWLAWDVAGGSAWKALGLITGGSGPRIESGERERGGSGGMTTQIKTEGLIDYPGDVTVILTSAGSPILTNLLNTETALSFVGNLGEGVVRLLDFKNVLDGQVVLELPDHDHFRLGAVLRRGVRGLPPFK